jgi:hypothetical protein
MQSFRAYTERGVDERSSWKEDVRSDARTVGPDALIRDSLPALFWLIENGQAEQEVDDLRRLAPILLTTRSRRQDQDLDQVVGVATHAFGELRGILLSKYPAADSLLGGSVSALSRVPLGLQAAAWSQPEEPPISCL